VGGKRAGRLAESRHEELVRLLLARLVKSVQSDPHAGGSAFDGSDEQDCCSQEPRGLLPQDLVLLHQKISQWQSLYVSDLSQEYIP
jgi:hypothetical protein